MANKSENIKITYLIEHFFKGLSEILETFEIRVVLDTEIYKYEIVVQKFGHILFSF